MVVDQRAWKDAQKQFESWFSNKNQYVFQFHDTLAAMGASGMKNVKTTEHPSDYLVLDDGQFYFAEVKKSENPSSFPFSSIQPGQWRAAIRTVAANGNYYFFVRHDPSGQWYRVPAVRMIEQYKSGIKSIKWSLIQEYKYER